MSTSIHRCLTGLLLLLALAAAPASRAQDPGTLTTGAPNTGAPVVAAAASLRVALDEIAKAFTAETGTAVTLTYGATGNLVRQVEEGAPFQVFLAADEASVARLQKAGKTEGDSAVLVEGRLAIAAPKGSAVAVDGTLDGLKQALAAGKVRHVAIANPELAPYGRAAQEALTKAGLWEQVEPLLVQGESVGQAVQFVTTGAADAGLVAQSLLLAPDIASKVTQAAVDAGAYAPIRQGMTLLKGAGGDAQAFYAYLKSAKAAAVFERTGFNVPKG
jgi:molybdate transport system substrate-binding protein